MTLAKGYTPECYKTYPTPKHALGTLLEFPDGRRFRFARNGSGALAAAVGVQSVVPVANHLNIAVQAAAAIGAISVAVTLGATAVVADEYKDGYLLVNDAVGEGHIYRIKTHPAHAGTGTLVLTLYTDSPILVALTTSSEVTLVRNRFSQVVIHPSPATSEIVGVTPRAVAANAYFWAQTKGPAACLTQGTLVAGDVCVPSATTDGAVMPSAAYETDSPEVGRVMTVNATTEHSLVNLTLE